MTRKDRVKINKLPTGVLGLDDILGGGLPEFSFNIVAGTPGCGKTTLAHQFVFANATPERPALYFTVLGEPALKMLRYQQQYSFQQLQSFSEPQVAPNYSPQYQQSLQPYQQSYQHQTAAVPSGAYSNGAVYQRQNVMSPVMNQVSIRFC